MGEGHVRGLAVEHAVGALAARLDAGSRSGLQELSSEDRVAPGDARQPALTLGLASELGERQPAEHQRGQARHRSHRTTQLLEQQAQLDQAEARAAVRLRDGHAEQIGLAQRLPEPGVEGLVAGLELLQALRVELLLQDLAGEVP